jgi:hypothetical protein
MAMECGTRIGDFGGLLAGALQRAKPQGKALRKTPARSQISLDSGSNPLGAMIFK